MRRAALARTAIAALALAAAFLARADDRATARSYYVQEDASRRTVIVFVHGGAGSAQGTWKSAEADRSWPEMMAADEAFRGASIFVYSYASPWFRKALSVPQLGVDMRTVLSDRGVLDHRNIVFVAHSMGGLVVKEFLLRFSEHVARTRFVYFLGVPSKGTELTRVARYLTDNPQSRDVGSVEIGSFLERQLLEWRALHAGRPRFPVFCAYEMLPAPVYGAIVVDVSSAVEGCFEAPEAVVADHRQMVKPRSADTAVYVMLRDKYRRVLTQPAPPDPGSPRLVAAEFLTKGIGAASQGNHRGAIEMYHEAIKTDDGFARAYFWRGQAFATLRESERAVDDLQKALALGIDEPADRLQAERLLYRLSPPLALKQRGSAAPVTRSLGDPAPRGSPAALIDQLFSDDAPTRVGATAQFVLNADGDAKLLAELLDRAGGATADLGVTLNVLGALDALPREAVSRNRADVLRYLDTAREAGPQAADYAKLIRAKLGN
jgi:tetratricopeptide (TPR) repeat protein